MLAHRGDRNGTDWHAPTLLGVNLMAIPADDGAARLMAVATARTDRESFEEFYATHRASIGRALSVTLRDDHLASEALDEAMVRAYQRWGEVRQLASPTGRAQLEPVDSATVNALRFDS
jgi:hypothetical protein